MNPRASDGPPRADSLALEILDGLRGRPEAGEIVLGGYFALKRFADYRATNDLDAWWRTGRVEHTMQTVRQAMADVAARHNLELAVREWGETASFELLDGGRKIFSFQIAVRTATLSPPEPSEWHPVLLEGLSDTVGSKMNAVVQRGAPRDFLDIRETVTRGVVSVAQCWDWWARKNPRVSVAQARAQALHHLEALEQRRPLNAIEDAAARAAAQVAREWIRHTLLLTPPGVADHEEGEHGR